MRPTLRITLTALLVACSAAIGVITPSLWGSYLFRFNGFPIVLSGFLLGPAGGFWCGALADILAFILKPGGFYIPFFTLTSGITGALPVMIYQNLTRKSDGALRCNFRLLLLAIGLAQVATKVLLVTALRVALFGLPAMALALQTLVEQAVHVPLYAYGVWVVLQRVVFQDPREFRASALRWEAASNPETEPQPGLRITRSEAQA